MQLLYDKGPLENVPNKDRSFEPSTILEEKFFAKYGKEIKLDSRIYILSRLDYEFLEKNDFKD